MCVPLGIKKSLNINFIVAMDLIQDIIDRAKANPQHIVFPEGTEERTLKAADRLLRWHRPHHAHR